MYMNGEQSIQNKTTDNQDMSVKGSEKAFRLKAPTGFLIKNLLWICLIGELKVTTLCLSVVIVSDMADGHWTINSYNQNWCNKVRTKSYQNLSCHSALH